MDPFVLSALAVILISLGFGFAFMWATRGIEYLGPGTDNAKQALAASQSSRWRYPSDLHLYGEGKTYMKDTVVILLAGFQRLLGDFKSDFPLVALSGFSVAAAAILSFFVGYGYWGLIGGIFSWVMTLSSLWLWKLAMAGCAVLVSQVCFFAAIGLIQLTGALQSEPLKWTCLALAGAFGCLMFYGSASSRKYLILILGALLFPALAERGYSLVWILDQLIAPVDFALLCGFVALSLYQFAYRPTVFLAFRLPWPGLSGLRARLLSHYSEEKIATSPNARRIFKNAVKTLAKIPAGLLIIHLALGWAQTAAFLLGILSMFFVLNFPRFFENLSGYFHYSAGGQTSGHFQLYREYFKKIGKPISENMRGAGWKWVALLLRQLWPVGLLSLGIAVGILFYASGWFWGLLVLLVGLSPILWGEITQGPQIGRSYVPCFPGILLIIGVALEWVNTQSSMVAWVYVLISAAVSLIWSYKNFAQDVYPSRMASTFLIRTLRKLGISEITVLESSYYNALTRNILADHWNGIKVKTVSSLEQAKGSYFVVPGTSSKALYMESESEAVKGGDFRSDPELNRLLDSREIKKFAIAQFKMMGCSPFWAQESEVPSYRHLVLREVGEEDIWRSYAWLLKL